MAGSAPARIVPLNVVHAIRGKVTFASATGKYEIGTLPAGAIVLRSSCYIPTLFNGTTPAITLGTGGTAAAFGTSATIAPATAGFKPSLTGTGYGDTLTADTPVVVGTTFAGDTTAGEAQFCIEFYPQKT